MTYSYLLPASQLQTARLLRKQCEYLHGETTWNEEGVKFPRKHADLVASSYRTVVTRGKVSVPILVY